MELILYKGRPEHMEGRLEKEKRVYDLLDQLSMEYDRLDHEAAMTIGSARLSFADAEFMEKFLDITPGAVSIMGLMNDVECNVRLLVDEDVLKGEYLGCHPCVNTSSLKLRTQEVFDKFLKAVNHDMTVVHLGSV